MEIPEGHKQCTACGDILALTAENFQRDADQSSGFDSWCKTCSRAKDRERRGLSKTNTDKALVLAGLKLIEKESELKGDVPHSAHLVEACYSLCGGVIGYATKLWQQYESAEAGEYGRTRILELVARLTVQNSNIGGARKPAELMTDEELAAERKRLILEVFQPAREETA